MKHMELKGLRKNWKETGRNLHRKQQLYFQKPENQFWRNCSFVREHCHWPGNFSQPGTRELATIYLQEELTVIGKMETAADAVIDLPTVSRIHAKIRKQDGEYYLTDLNSRNGTSVNGKMIKSSEEYCLQDQDEVDFAQARYVFLK